MWQHVEFGQFSSGVSTLSAILVSESKFILSYYFAELLLIILLILSNKLAVAYIQCELAKETEIQY